MQTTSNNVIMFPNSKIIRDENITGAEIDNNMLFIKLNHINETLSVILPMIFNNIELAGFSLPDENVEHNSDINIKDGTFIVESIRSLLCKYYGLYHPFQELSDNIFDVENEFDILPSVNINFSSKIYNKNDEE